MKKSREELTLIHKEKCRELKEVRARIAADLGIELHQRVCTYEGYCSGTCPACRSEEIKLNAAILKKQMEGMNLKGRSVTAGLAAAAALCLSGCTFPGQNVTEGATVMPEGDVEFSGTEQTDDIPDDSGSADIPESSALPECEIQGLLEPDDSDVEGLLLKGENGEGIPETSEANWTDTPEDQTNPYFELEGDYELQGEVIPDMDGPAAMPMEDGVDMAPETEEQVQSKLPGTERRHE